MWTPILETVLKFIKGAHLKKIIVVTLLLYPLALAYLFKNEIGAAFSGREKIVKVKNVDVVLKRAYGILAETRSEAVAIYIYQPDGSRKNYKELVACASSSFVMPETFTNIDLGLQPDVMMGIRKGETYKVTYKCDTYMQHVLEVNKISFCLFVPLTDAYNARIGECVILTNHPELVNGSVISSIQTLTFEMF